MFAICIESSHSKGMGHLFRMLNFSKYLKKQNKKFIFIVNDNEKSKDILRSHKIPFEIVSLEDLNSGWEAKVIKKYNVLFWINDRLDTDEKHSKNIKNQNIKLITFDDLGGGAKYSDINICGLFFNKNNLKGKTILKGVEYLILNPEIDLYKKQRKSLKHILVTLGGSDTYGVTIKVLKLLKKYNITATIHIGASFEHHQDLADELTDDYQVITYIPSFIKEFSKYDLAITGGGITPFEANASGLPCLIIANELFEIENGEYLHSIGSSLFLGFHENIDDSKIQGIEKLNLEQMSQNGLLKLDIKAVNRIYKEILKL